jgi:hypothetical protein
MKFYFIFMYLSIYTEQSSDNILNIYIYIYIYIVAGLHTKFYGNR